MASYPDMDVPCDAYNKLHVNYAIVRFNFFLRARRRARAWTKVNEPHESTLWYVSVKPYSRFAFLPFCFLVPQSRRPISASVSHTGYGISRNATENYSTHAGHPPKVATSLRDSLE